MAKSVRALSEYTKEYNERFQTMMDHGLKSREDNYKQEMADILRLGVSKKPRVLAIGSGNGEVDQFVINTLLDTYDDIHYCVVEPASSPLNDFKRLIQSYENRWNSVTFDFHEEGINEYLAEGGASENFDLIHAFHSVYFFRDAGSVLSQLYGMLRHDGMLFIKVAAGAIEKWYLQRAKISNIFFPHSCQVQELSSRELPSITMEITCRPYTMNITECFNENSEDGNKMLDFINQKLDYRRSTPLKQVEYCLHFLRDECSEVRNDEILFLLVDDDIVVRKV
ncbi:histamine N-methyltransferase-like [Saccoglossus kowalevskii]|uniref:Histamine N-methyltransferase-like n=1 Tax=Saccoglossus kowalevskii TaxID=10224 RepID=A0ABM0GUZ3_SACKO|nr:PREDICTED: histamine N-methyltransferase-like [Saccoglossus kowalevskii]